MLSATIPSSRPNNAGWYDTHKKHVIVSESTRSNVVLIGDSIIAGLNRYKDICHKYFSKALNLGIRGDRTEHVLWRSQRIKFSKSVKFIIIHCGTNNLDSDLPYTIANGIASIGSSFRKSNPGIKVILLGILPRDTKSSVRRGKIDKTNYFLEQQCGTLNSHYLKHDLDWV